HPIRAHMIMHGRRAVQARVDELLVQVGLAAADGARYPHQFSGGQRQRISIARALASEPEFLVCDEPTSALDVSVQAQVLNLMRDLQRSFGLTYLFISHNLAVIYQVSDRVGVMYCGRLVEIADSETLFARPLHPYTRMLFETIPRLDTSAGVSGEREPVAGEVPSPIDPPPGCPFHPRCPFANDRCRAERPELIAADGAMVACHAVEEGRLPAFTTSSPR
ncbi:MAG: oligopeptide/dipeptide ABC transporter ATP-binding protein, partial [Stellaceae bacterium]